MLQEGQDSREDGMRASRGMGCINPAKMPKGVVKQRRDNTDFTEYAEGGEAKSKVNAAGNYTKPGMRKKLLDRKSVV